MRSKFGVAPSLVFSLLIRPLHLLKKDTLDHFFDFPERVCVHAISHCGEYSTLQFMSSLLQEHFCFCSPLALGKCFSALPFTAPLETISIAFAIASSSSVRSCCLDSKSDAFCSHVTTKSARYFLSASLVVVVSVRSPFASAFACNFFALVSAFSVRSCFA